MASTMRIRATVRNVDLENLLKGNNTVIATGKFAKDFRNYTATNARHSRK